MNAGSGQGQRDANGAAKAAEGGADKQGVPAGGAHGGAAQASGGEGPPRARDHRARSCRGPALTLPTLSPQVARHPSLQASRGSAAGQDQEIQCKGQGCASAGKRSDPLHIKICE